MAARVLGDEDFAAGAEFLRHLGQTLRVVTAFWLRNSKNRRWTLYAAVEGVESGLHTFEALEPVKRAAAAMPEPKFDISQVTLVRPTDYLVQGVMRETSQKPGRYEMEYDDDTIDMIPVSEIYLYPPSAYAPAAPATP
jgi:hypothetical protein